MAASDRPGGDVSRQKLRMREEQVQDLRSRYAKHGDDVLAAVIQAFQADGNLRKLTHRITGRLISDQHGQHQALQAFLEKHEAEVFLRQAQTREMRMIPGSPEPGVREPTAEPYQGAERPSGAVTRRTSPGPKRLVKMPDGSVVEERRAGKDRRQAEDRRGDVDVVYKNRRYGGDRRTGQDRRKI